MAGPVAFDGRPAGFRFDGRLVWVWWGQDEQGIDVVAVAGSRVRAFATEAACRAAFEPVSAESRPGSVLLLGPDHLRAPEHLPFPDDGPDFRRGPDHLPFPDDGPASAAAVPMAELAPGPERTDLGPAQEWAAGRRFVVPVESALDLWNWGVDIARSTRRPFVQRGQIRDACYQKLVAAQVPWMYGRDSYRPTWSPTQLTALRSTLNDAIHLIRAALR